MEDCPNVFIVTYLLSHKNHLSHLLSSTYFEGAASFYSGNKMLSLFRSLVQEYIQSFVYDGLIHLYTGKKWPGGKAFGFRTEVPGSDLL